MTARVRTLGRLSEETLRNYCGQGRPAGIWVGTGAKDLCLHGAPTRKQLRALMDAKHPGTGAQLGHKFSTSNSRPSAHGYDLTFAVPKDISVYWALTNAAERDEIEAAVNAAALAVLEHLDTTSPIRVNRDVVTGTGLVIGVFPQYVSRAGDPNLALRCVISSKVRNPETGKWYALDARELTRHQRAWSALFHKGLEAELTRRLGFAWGDLQGNGLAAPLLGANRDLCAALSSQTTFINAVLETKTDRFKTTIGREPNPLEQHRLHREAAVVRPARRQIRHASDEEHRWTQTATAIAGKNRYVADVKAHKTPPLHLTPSVAAEVARAIEPVREQVSKPWQIGRLVTEIARNLPSGLDLAAADLVAQVYQWSDIQPPPGDDPGHVVDCRQTTPR